MPREGMTPKYIRNKGTLFKSIRYAREGMSRTQISKMLGLNADTIFVWIRNAKNHPDDYPILVRWFSLLQRAESMYEREMVAKITETAKSSQPNTWQAAAWMLERRDPESWGRRDKTTIEHTGEPLVQVNALVLEDRDTREASRDFLRRITSGSPDLTLGPGVGDDEEERREQTVDSREAR